MSTVWYLLALLFGAFGILALLRSVELLVTGGRATGQVLIAIVGLLLAWQSFRKARSTTQAQK
jgi:hypothetical protein